MTALPTDITQSTVFAWLIYIRLFIYIILYCSLKKNNNIILFSYIYLMSFNDTQIQLLQNLYNDASLGLTTGQKLFSCLKSNGETGYTLSKINEFLKSLEVNQVLTKRRGDISFVAEGPLEQFQIDLVFMPKSWFNQFYGFEYIFCCVDVFGKKADMIPLEDREQTTTTKAFEK